MWDPLLLTGTLSTKAIAPGINVVAFSANPTFDASLGNSQKIVLMGTVASSNLTNPVAGEQLNFVVCQDGAGGHTFTFPSNFRSPSGPAPKLLGTAANTCTLGAFLVDSDGATVFQLSAFQIAE